VAADSMTLNTTGSLNAGTGVVTLESISAGVNLGTKVSGKLSLTDAELATVTAGTLKLGNEAFGGPITISAPINVSDNPNPIPTLHLMSGGAIVDANSTGADVTATNLALDGFAGPSSATTLTVQATNLAASYNTSSDLNLVALGGTTVSTVDGDIGVFDLDRNLTLTSMGPLTINSSSGSVGGVVKFTVASNDQLLTVNALVNGQSDCILAADKMSLQNSVSFPFGTLTLVPESASDAGDAINLGSATDAAANTLELSSAELAEISAKTLKIGDAASGAITVSSTVTVASGTNVTLTSGGAINFTSGSFVITNGGNLTLAPASSASVGIHKSSTDVNVGTGTLSFANGTNLAIPINGTTVDTQYDQLNVNGNVNLTGVNLQLSGTYAPAIGDKFTIVNNALSSRTTTGTFTALSEGQVFSIVRGGTNVDLQITYHGGDGNDVVLTAINVAPTLVVETNDPVTILEDDVQHTVNLSGISAGGTRSQTLTVTAISSNPSLIPNPSVNYTPSNATGSISYKPVADQNGTAVITVTVQDNGGTAAGSDSISQSFTVQVAEVNDPPVANDDTASVAEDSAAGVLVDVLANDSKGPANESSQTLTITGVGTAAHGSVSIQNGKVLYVPTQANYNGPDSFTYTITDNGTTSGAADPLSSTGTVNITVTEVNDPPIANPDAATVAEDSVGNIIDVLSNDSPGPANESGQTLTVTAATALHGIVTINANGTLSYRPDADYNGPDTIGYTIEDNGTTNGAPDPLEAQSTVSLTVTEVNDPPIAVNDTLPSVAEDSGQGSIPFSALLANDLPGPANESNQTLAITGISNIVGGTAVIFGDNVVFTPADDFNGTFSFSYSIIDNGTTNGINDFKTATGTASFTVTEINDSPTGVNDALPNILEDAQQTIPFTTLLANDLKGPANESGQTLTIVAVDSAVGGTVSIVGTDVVFAPTADYNGPAGFVYTLVDNGTTNGQPDPKTSTATVSFTIDAVNDAPILELNLNLTPIGASDENPATHGPALPTTVPGFVVSATPGPPTATDEASQHLSFVVTSDNGALFAQQPAIDPTTGNLIFRVAPNANGTAHVSVTLKDDGGTAHGGVDATTAPPFDIVVTKTHIWHNTKNALDVNDDSHVAANDVVAVVNYINAFGNINGGHVPALGAPLPSGIGVAGVGTPFGFLDVNADDFVTAADALAIINVINAGQAGGEGEVASTGDDLITLLAVDVASQGKRRGT
jgi:VCBS repeat-containing protein